jgi:hypothetical protein
MKQWLSQFLVITIALQLAACKTAVRIDPSDKTQPIVKMDLYGLDEPGYDFISFSDCCRVRRTVRISDELNILASAEDIESGISSLEIVAVVYSECVVIRSFRGSRGVPDGPPVGQRNLRQIEHVLASTSVTTKESANSLPQKLLAKAKTRLKDLSPEPCPSIKFFVNDDPPTAVTIAEQGTTFCGVRVFARAKNGLGQTQSTATILLVEGPPGSGAFPCAAVPI